MDEKNRALLDRMMVLCSKREYCEADIRRKLYDAAGKDGSIAADAAIWQETVEMIVGTLKKEKFLDDSRYAEAFARDKSAILGWGTVKIRHALAAKGISMECIDSAMSSADTEKGLEKRVHLLHGVSVDDLPALYRLAELFVYPSRFEGFGIPIIEALHAGVPVIAATGSCLEEAGGEDSCYIHPDDVEGLAQTACSLLQTPETCERMIRQGKEYVQRFSEKEEACQLMNLYRALMK